VSTLPATIELALAPMDGVTDDLVRGMFASWGALDYCVTEFVRVTDTPLSEKVLRRECPELASGCLANGTVPVHVQLLGGSPERMAESARTAVNCGATVIDLNFGCPAPTVNRHDGGASLLRDPCRVEAVTAAVRLALPAHVPVSAKVRLGWSDPDDIVTIARAAEAGGASWLTVHGRTRVQGYAPSADWVRIGRARAAVRIPVVANGDLRSPDDVARCREITGCERFMIGRGAIERPELFRVIRGIDGWWTSGERIAVLDAYVLRARARGGWTEHGVLGRVKQWARALAQGDAAIAPLFERVKRCERLDEARAIVREAMKAAGDAQCPDAISNECEPHAFTSRTDAASRASHHVVP
jgi:tRNA-dihydrouridine synthase C